MSDEKLKEIERYWVSDTDHGKTIRELAKEVRRLNRLALAWQRAYHHGLTGETDALRWQQFHSEIVNMPLEP